MRPPVAGKRKRARKRVKLRNPFAPALRRLRPKVKPSARAYSRKPKHKRSREESDNGGGQG